MILQILRACAAESEPPNTVKSWLNTKTSRPLTSAVAGDHAVAGNALAVHAEVVAVVLDEHVPFLEGPFVEQDVDALARRQLALAVLRRDPALAAAHAGPAAFFFELIDDVVHRRASACRSPA